jgi:hypothetical protein
MATAMSLAVDPRAAESLLAFWADAGVDATYADAPIDRLAEGAAMLRAKSQPQAVAPPSDRRWWPAARPTSPPPSPTPRPPRPPARIWSSWPPPSRLSTAAR